MTNIIGQRILSKIVIKSFDKRVVGLRLKNTCLICDVERIGDPPIRKWVIGNVKPTFEFSEPYVGEIILSVEDNVIVTKNYRLIFTSSYHDDQRGISTMRVVRRVR